MLYGDNLEQHYEQAGVAEKAVAYLLKAGKKARHACQDLFRAVSPAARRAHPG